MSRLIKLLRARALGDVDEGAESIPAASSPEAGVVPLLLGSALLSATLVLLFLHFTSFALPKVVTFDIIKYANAQRAVASKFIGGSPKAAEDASSLLMDVSKHTRDAIREAAGPNSVVIISQALISANARDITDQVLTKLGLPTDVPTADAAHQVIDVAPTFLGRGPTFTVDKTTPEAPKRDTDRPSVLP